MTDNRLQPGRCSTCGAPVLMGRLLENGKVRPVVVDRTRNLVRRQFRERDDGFLELVEPYQWHYMNCKRPEQPWPSAVQGTPAERHHAIRQQDPDSVGDEYGGV